MIQQIATQHDETSRTAMVFAGILEPVDSRQSQAFGYREAVAIERRAYDTAIQRDDDGDHVDYNARTVDVLWKARIALDSHSWPVRVPFTVWPADRPVNLYAERGHGDTGEDVVTIAEAPALPFTVTAAGQVLPAINYYLGARLVPVVTVDVLHVLLAALLDTEQLVTFYVEDTPDNPVHITTSDGRATTLRSHRDGSYAIGLLTDFCDTDTLTEGS